MKIKLFEEYNKDVFNGGKYLKDDEPFLLINSDQFKKFEQNNEREDITDDEYNQILSLFNVENTLLSRPKFGPPQIGTLSITNNTYQTCPQSVYKYKNGWWIFIVKLRGSYPGDSLSNFLPWVFYNSRVLCDGLDGIKKYMNNK